MRIFVSWSGERSKTAALGLKTLLDDIFRDDVEVFISDYIEPGEIWARRLETELEESKFGILCLTQDNFQSPWLLFEAGAIAKKFGADRVRVVPYMIDPLPSVADRSPLTQFQRVRADAEGTFHLVKSINAVCTKPQGEERLKRTFKNCWVDFGQTLDALPVLADKQQSDREMLETILKRLDLLAQRQHDSTQPTVKLSSAELTHVLNLRYQPAINYTLNGNLHKELRHLRDLGLIKGKQGPIGELPKTFQLDQYFELSELGRDWVLKHGTSS